MEYKMICVLGPTASGKTRYAVELAKRVGGEIISADSRQVYRGMDIGTGKDLSEYGEIKYHLIDIVDAGEKYDIFRYKRDFIRAYEDIVARGKYPILCGGSGLYIETVTRDYHLQEVPPNLKLREALEKEDMDTLVTKLASLKKLHNTTDYDTKKRVIRAIEIAMYQSEHVDYKESSDTIPFELKDVKFIGISVTPQVRNERIDKRLEARLKEGMVDEVRYLMNEKGLTAENLIYYGLEYKFITQYLIGELEYDVMVDKLRIAIHQFAKRQMTWFRGMERKGIQIEWLEL